MNINIIDLQFFPLNFFLLNSANVALLLSTISNSYAKMGNQDTADRL